MIVDVRILRNDDNEVRPNTGIISVSVSDGHDVVMDYIRTKDFVLTEACVLEAVTLLLRKMFGETERT